MFNKKSQSREKMAKIQVIISSVLTIALFVIVAMLLSCGISIIFKVDMYFWAGTIGSTIAVMLTFITWTPTGEQLALKLTKVQNGIKVYNGRANYIIKHQMFKSLRDFCDHKNEELEKTIITEMLSEYNIGYEVYELKKNRNRTKEQEERLNQQWELLSEKEREYVSNLASKKIKCEKLLPAHITVGKATKHTIINKNNEKAYKIGRLAMKSFWGIFTTCFTYFIVVTPNKNFGIPQVIMIIMWFFTFLMSIFGAIRTGYNAVINHRHVFNVNQSLLCAEFFDFAGVQLEKVDVEMGIEKEVKELYEDERKDEQD